MYKADIDTVEKFEIFMKKVVKACEEQSEFFMMCQPGNYDNMRRSIYNWIKENPKHRKILNRIKIIEEVTLVETRGYSSDTMQMIEQAEVF